VEIPTEVSLAVVAVILALATASSLLIPEAKAGRTNHRS
jgi:hypothetical protein